MDKAIGQGGSTERGVQRTSASIPTALLSSALGHQAPEMRVAPTTRFSDPRLAELESRCRDLGIGPQFHQVHHFASHKFSGKRERLDTFIAWCDGREIRDENAQTLERALDVACRVKDGQDFGEALEQAWTAYPIVTRWEKRRKPAPG
jgi:hypothetical protein